MPISRSFATDCCEGLGLQFPGRREEGEERDVDEDDVPLAHFEGKLAHGLNERQAFDVAHGAADFRHQHVHALAGGFQAVLDFVGDVRDDLHRLAQVVAPALLLDDGLVHLARG